MSLSRKAILAGVLIATLIVFSAVMNMATKPRMAFLYGGLDASASGDVLSALEAMDVEAEVRGEAIYVPEHRRDALRMALARQGLPQQSQPGFELLDELNGFATTSEMFDAAYWRAKEGELARTLLATPGVKSARVHIAVPKASSFARRRRPPSASATITMSRGRLDLQQATAMRYLIALAVPDMQPEQVAVIDSVNGVILKPGAADPVIQAEGDSLDRERRMEGDLMDLLEARVGPGNARVTVALDIDREHETVSERILDPESRVMMGRETTDMQQSEQGGASGAVTVASNLPDGDAGGQTSQSNSSRSETNESTRFDISEVNRQREKLPGAIARVHVAVLINDAPGENGAEPAPRGDAELESIRQLVAASVGYNETRGDIVTVKSMPFHEFEAVETPAETGGIMLWAQQNVMSILQIVIPAIVVIVLGMFVLKPVLTQDIGGASAATQLIAAEPAELQPAGQIARSPLEELRDLSSSDKEATTTLLKQWLGETERAA
jgi:flagellar M-ring protein FliF